MFSCRDRLLLLLQSFTGYAEMVLSGRAVPPARGLRPCMSAGLTARTFWSTMLKLGAFCQQLQDEVGHLGISRAESLPSPPGFGSWSFSDTLWPPDVRAPFECWPLCHTSVPSQPESLSSSAPSCATASILLQDLGMSELGCL